MMKSHLIRNKKLLILGLLAFNGMSLLAQGYDTPVVRKESGSTPPPRRRVLDTAKGQDLSLSTSYQEFLREAPYKFDDASWMRTVYRRLDLNKEPNAVLYYPEVAVEDRRSLIAIAFDLLNSQKILAYEYLDGYEIFDANHRVDFKMLLEKLQIPFRPSNRGSGLLAQIEETDIPTVEVKSYFIKEQYLFDEVTSSTYRQVEAFCPILSTTSEYGDELNIPLFWIKYQDIRPYLSRQKTMLSSKNNVMQASLDDFFSLSLYEGEIVKTMNLENKSLLQLYPDTTVRTQEAAKIEGELKNIQTEIYQMDSTMYQPKEQEGRPSQKTEATDKRGINSRDKRVGSKNSSSRPASRSSSEAKSVRRSVRRK